MSRVKNANRDLLILKLDDETDISHFGSDDAALSCSDAVWIFPVSEVSGDGGVWADGVPLLREQQDDCGDGIRSAGVVVSAYLQDCVRAFYMECC